MSEGFGDRSLPLVRTVWAVGPLLRAIADSLSARFNPVTVRAEISGFSRAASGHCYFNLKDSTGQVRCAMFRRAAEQLSFNPADGALVEVEGKLDIYGPRGDLQLVVERMRPAGQGALFEQFMRLKARLEAEGLFDPGRKRELPVWPRSVGVVTSLGAAALRDVVTALRRRVPHLPVVIYPASVQGAQAPDEIVGALRQAYSRHPVGECDVLLLVRGGGSLEDLWCFNDERVVRTVVAAPMPVICGVGHETDFTLADFAADLRAPTPTAAAELCAPPRHQLMASLELMTERLTASVDARLDLNAQRLDRLAQRLGKPSGRLHEARQSLLSIEHRLNGLLQQTIQRERRRTDRLAPALREAMLHNLQVQQRRVERCTTALRHLDPQTVLDRGYAYVSDMSGRTITRAAQVAGGDRLHVTMADGALEVLAADPEK
ncbi:exodeoxyribonuclease VII large subunit [Hydrogenophaga sp.]|uniref:exodeoxyribonuclease VII large subunit n=1 Tax=Hydrogenophaga sp. TaxID=1904254 RepID=UPI0035B19792